MPHNIIKPYIKKTDIIAAARNLPINPVKEPDKTSTKSTKSTKNPDKSPKPIQTKTNITPSDYIQIPQTNIIISKFEIQGLNNLNYEQTHKKILKQGLHMPTPKTFMSHFSNILDAYNNNKPIYDASGNTISDTELKEIYKHLTTSHIAAYGKRTSQGAWTWLNAKFISGTGFNNLNLETITGLDADNNLITSSLPLEPCLWDDCYSDLEFNSQGLALKRARNQEYNQGQNIYFWKPTPNYVAGFYAYSDWAVLYCDGLSSYRSVSLGVFACAEGAKKI